MFWVSRLDLVVVMMSEAITLSKEVEEVAECICLWLPVHYPKIRYRSFIAAYLLYLVS